MSAGMRGVPRKQATCEHCGITSIVPNILRWHGNKCPYKGKKTAAGSKEHARRISLAKKGRSPAWNKGVPRTDAVKKKISAARKGMRLSEESRKKIGFSLRGGKRTDATRAKMSAARTRWWANRRKELRVTCL